MAVRISVHFGIVIRKAALARVGMSTTKLVSVMEASGPHDEDARLISFGPHFGEEAADELVRRLKNAGLEYPDDFFLFSNDVPEWCELSCTETAVPIVEAPLLTFRKR